MKYYTICLFVILSLQDSRAQIVINEIIPPDTVELLNLGMNTVDISSYILCDYPSYDVLSTETSVFCGSLNLSGGDIVTVVTTTISLDPLGSELGLYTSSLFDDPDNIVDYVEWGTNCPHFRSITAQEAGIWTSDDCVPAWSDCASLEYDGAGNSDSDWMTQNLATTCAENTLNGCTPLSLEIISFRAFRQGPNVILHMLYVDDGNTLNYQLQHSVDLDIWKTIAQFDLSNIVNIKTESFIHSDPAIGINYYRMLITSIDGTIEYSAIESVSIEDEIKEFNVFPNPANRVLSIRTERLVKGFEYRIVDLVGRVVLEGIVDGSESVNISILIKGLYVFSVPAMGQSTGFIKI